jgi:hypothetical protein
MTENQIIFDLEEMEHPLRLAKVAVRKGYLGAALAYFDDIESEAIRLRKACKELRANAPRVFEANLLLHPNDPAFEPLEND